MKALSAGREPRFLLGLVAAFAAGCVVAAVSVGVVARADTGADPGGDLAARIAAFRRPAMVPFPVTNPYSEQKRALGERLFHDPALSANGKIACATCHDRTAGFGDRRARSIGLSQQTLARHTPTLWNLAWTPLLFWDGRARGLEEQVAGPIESHDEMGQPLEGLTARLQADPTYAKAFAGAFPEDPHATPANLAKAIAVFERSLVSPPTRFDRWVEGDATVLSAQEVEGFRLFTGKAGCANCHRGWAFTDSAFHDIGLPGDDRGRGAVLQLDAAEHAFKTPGLREITRSAPYMHDGSLAALEDVVRHYESGIVERPTLSPDLPRRLDLTDGERAALIAFLGRLTSETPTPGPIVATLDRSVPPAMRVRTVVQNEKLFTPVHVALKRGERLWIVNNDIRTHNVRIFDAAMEFDSGAQEPGETLDIPFPAAGSFLVFCGIHPKMELIVDVEP